MLTQPDGYSHGTCPCDQRNENRSIQTKIYTNKISLDENILHGFISEGFVWTDFLLDDFFWKILVGGGSVWVILVWGDFVWGDFVWEKIADVNLSRKILSVIISRRFGL